MTIFNQLTDTSDVATPLEKLTLNEAAFPVIWYRILAHIAADEVKKIRGKHKKYSAAESAIEEWEEYCGRELIRVGEREQLPDGHYWLLF